MLRYNGKLKKNSRKLRAGMTDPERLLWSHVKGKQILDVQFYRQKPLGNYIVDFYAPKANLVIEVDGSQHLEREHMQRDAERDAYLSTQGLLVIRFSNRQVMHETDVVLTQIFEVVSQRLAGGNPPQSPSIPLNPPQSPFSKGGGS